MLCISRFIPTIININIKRFFTIIGQHCPIMTRVSGPLAKYQIVMSSCFYSEVGCWPGGEMGKEALCPWIWEFFAFCFEF